MEWGIPGPIPRMVVGLRAGQRHVITQIRRQIKFHITVPGMEQRLSIPWISHPDWISFLALLE